LSLGVLDESCGLAPIEDLSALRHLQLWPYSDRALACLNPLDKITSLTLCASSGKGDLSVVVNAFPRVADLNIVYFDGLDLAPLIRLPLDELRLQICSCADLQPLTQIPSLRKLWLNDVAAHLSPLAGLELQLALKRGQSYVGLDKFGPDVKITYFG
jgi:hypothetical protein